MKKIVYYNNLYDLYGEFLTEKQQMYFEDYYFHDLTLGEMAENYQVSRNALFKQIHLVIEKLDGYEEKLHLLEKKQKLEALIPQIDSLEIREKLQKLL